MGKERTNSTSGSDPDTFKVQIHEEEGRKIKTIQVTANSIIDTDKSRALIPLRYVTHISVGKDTEVFKTAVKAKKVSSERCLTLWDSDGIDMNIVVDDSIARRELIRSIASHKTLSTKQVIKLLDSGTSRIPLDEDDLKRKWKKLKVKSRKSKSESGSRRKSSSRSDDESSSSVNDSKSTAEMERDAEQKKKRRSSRSRKSSTFEFGDAVKWNVTRFEGRDRVKEVMILEDGIVYGQKFQSKVFARLSGGRTQLLDLDDIKQLSVGKMTPLLLSNKKSRYDSNELYFSFKLGPHDALKSVDFRVKSSALRVQILKRILDELAIIGKVPRGGMDPTMRTIRYLEKEEVMLIDIVDDHSSRSNSQSRQKSKSQKSKSKKKKSRKRSKSKSRSRRKSEETDDDDSRSGDDEKSGTEDGRRSGEEKESENGNQSENEEEEESEDEIDPDAEWNVLKWKNMKRKKKVITMGENAVMDVVEGTDNKIMIPFKSIKTLCLGKCTKGTKDIDSSKLAEQFISIIPLKGVVIDLQSPTADGRYEIAMAILKALDVAGREPVNGYASTRRLIRELTPLENLEIEIQEKEKEVEPEKEEEQNVKPAITPPPEVSQVADVEKVTKHPEPEQKQDAAPAVPENADDGYYSSGLFRRPKVFQSEPVPLSPPETKPKSEPAITENADDGYYSSGLFRRPKTFEPEPSTKPKSPTPEPLETSAVQNADDGYYSSGLFRRPKAHIASVPNSPGSRPQSTGNMNIKKEWIHKKSQGRDAQREHGVNKNGATQVCHLRNRKHCELFVGKIHIVKAVHFPKGLYQIVQVQCLSKEGGEQLFGSRALKNKQHSRNQSKVCEEMQSATFYKTFHVVNGAVNHVVFEIYNEDRYGERTLIAGAVLEIDRVPPCYHMTYWLPLLDPSGSIMYDDNGEKVELHLTIEYRKNKTGIVNGDRKDTAEPFADKWYLDKRVGGEWKSKQKLLISDDAVNEMRFGEIRRIQIETKQHCDCNLCTPSEMTFVIVSGHGEQFEFRTNSADIGRLVMNRIIDKIKERTDNVPRRGFYKAKNRVSRLRGKDQMTIEFVPRHDVEPLRKSKKGLFKTFSQKFKRRCKSSHTAIFHLNHGNEEEEKESIDSLREDGGDRQRMLMRSYHDPLDAESYFASETVSYDERDGGPRRDTFQVIRYRANTKSPITMKITTKNIVDASMELKCPQFMIRNVDIRVISMGIITPTLKHNKAFNQKRAHSIFSLKGTVGNVLDFEINDAESRMHLILEIIKNLCKMKQFRKSTYFQAEEAIRGLGTNDRLNIHFVYDSVRKESAIKIKWVQRGTANCNDHDQRQGQRDWNIGNRVRRFKALKDQKESDLCHRKSIKQWVQPKQQNVSRTQSESQMERLRKSQRLSCSTDDGQSSYVAVLNDVDLQEIRDFGYALHGKPPEPKVVRRKRKSNSEVKRLRHEMMLKDVKLKKLKNLLAAC